MLFAVVGASSDPEESLLGVKDQLQKTGQADVADRLKAITAEDKKYGATYDDVVPKGQSAAKAPRTSPKTHSRLGPSQLPTCRTTAARRPRILATVATCSTVPTPPSSSWANKTRLPLCGS